MSNPITQNLVLDDKSNIPFQKLDLALIDHIKNENSKIGLAEYSKRNLRTIGEQFNSFLGIKERVINEESIKGFLKQLKLSQAGPTWNLSRQNLKKLLRHQVSIRGNHLKRIIVDEIFSDIKTIKPEKKITTYLSYDQVLELIKGSSNRVGLIIEFLFKTGCRISELTGVRLMDIRCEKQIKVSLTGKGSKSRTVHIDYQLYESINAEFGGKHYLFENRNHHRLDRSNIFRKIKGIGKSVLGLNIHPHTMRHSTANYLLQSCGKSAKFVSEYLGHSSPAITLEMYIHEKPGDEIVDLFNRPSHDTISEISTRHKM